MKESRLRVEPLTRLVGLALAGALAAGVVAACGSGGQGGPDESTAPATTSAAPSTEPPSSTEPTQGEESEPMTDEHTPYLDPSLGSDKPREGHELTITGTVESGVESGCLVIEHDGTVYGIFGDYDESVVYAGAEVTLRGYPDPTMMSFCQQGTPFVVQEAGAAR